MELIEQRRAAILGEKEGSSSEKPSAIEGDKTIHDRDLLSVLSESSELCICMKI